MTAQQEAPTQLSRRFSVPSEEVRDDLWS